MAAPASLFSPDLVPRSHSLRLQHSLDLTRQEVTRLRDELSRVRLDLLHARDEVALEQRKRQNAEVGLAALEASL
jgi:hypothetical protein